MTSGGRYFKLKVLLIVAVIFTAAAVIYIFVQIRGYDRDLNWAISREEQSLDSIVTLLEQFYLDTNSQRFISIVRDISIVSAFAARDRDKLYDSILPHYLALKLQHTAGLNMHFHLPDGTSFLRMHQPHNHGDDLREVRPVIQEVHRKRVHATAYEIGRSGCFYRIVEPLFVGDDYIGAAEIGIPVCTFAEEIRNLLRIDTCLFFLSDRWNKVKNTRPRVQTVGEFSVIFPDIRNYNLPLPQENLMHDLHRTIEFNSKVNIVHSLPIFKDIDGNIIGGIITYQDITPFVLRKRGFVSTALSLMGVLFAVSMVLLYFTLGRLVDRVQAHQKKQAELLGSLEEEIQQRKRSEKERNSLQAQFLQSQKMEALGLLSSGVAHDFNNLLTTIMGYTQLILRTARLDEDVQRQLHFISSAGERAAGLIRQLLAFSRRQTIEMKPLNLATVVKDLSKMLIRLLGENIELVLDLDEEQALVKGDRTQIEQILMNLAVNARDAMPQGGLLTIAVRPLVVEEAISCAFSDVGPGTYVMLAFTDTGMGIDESLMERIFEPFFTTKPEGKGTGLGLSTVFGIIAQHNGQVCVESEIGKGTTFKMTFPILQRRKDDVVQAEKPRQLLLGNETVLVVEDEQPIQEVVKDMLSSLGYTVLIAQDAAEAESLFAKEQDRISVVLADLVLPDMNGHELSGRLREKKKGLKVVYMSGYADEMLTNYGLDLQQVRFLHKPLGIERVAEAIRAVIDQE